MAAVGTKFWNGAASASSSLPPTDGKDGKEMPMAQAALSASAAASSDASLESRSIVVGETSITFSSSKICNKLRNTLLLMEPERFAVLAIVKKMMIDQNASASDVKDFLETQFDSDTQAGCVSIARAFFDLSRCQQYERRQEFDKAIDLLLFAHQYITKMDHPNTVLKAAIKYALALVLVERNRPEDEALIETYFLEAKGLDNRGSSITIFMEYVIFRTLPRRIAQGAEIGSWLGFMVEHSFSLTQDQLVARARDLYNQSMKMEPAYAIECLNAAQTLLSRDGLIATDSLEHLKGLILQRLGKLSSQVDAVLGSIDLSDP